MLSTVRSEIQCRNFAIVLLAAWLSAAPALAIAEVTINESFSYYDINGKTINELRKSINAIKIEDSSTSEFDASTVWTIKWQYEYLDEPCGCIITAATVTTNIKYRLPRWPGFERSENTVLKTTWSKYINSLTQHELEHGQLTKNVAGDIDHSLLNHHDIHSGLSCGALGEEANDAVNRMIDKLKKLHDKFDRVTNHGINTGAVLP